METAFYRDNAIIALVRKIVDIVVPVYRGEQETRTCLESVLASPTTLDREIVVIDDASPEPTISAWLRELSGQGAITLVTHAQNRGFVAAVNAGIALHPDRDVVLLNSDTEVARGWLDRLHGAVSRDHSVATATPFSSNATICSYPRTLVANPLPAGETTASLDVAFAAANSGMSVDITTAVGFCMCISRAALNTVGAFDEARYGTGYGEEVDFCMRTARAGLRNVIAADVFVRHVGEISFGSAGADRRARAQATVDALYPEFQVKLREFLAIDPVKPLRRRADLVRLVRGAVSCLAVEASDCRHIKVWWNQPGEEFALWFEAGDWDRMFDLLRLIGTSSSAPLPDLERRWLEPPDRNAPPTAAGNARMVELEAQLQRIEQSHSWKLTAPMRTLARRVRELLA